MPSASCRRSRMLTLPTCSRELRCRRWSFTAVMMRGYHLTKAARSQPAFRARDSSRLKAAIMRFWKVNQPGRNFSTRRKLFSRRNIHLAADGGMSALGHERTYAVQKAMQIGHWRSHYRVFDHRGGRRGVRHDPDIIGRQAKSYWAAALCFSPAIASLIAVCTSQWRNRTTASMRSRNSTRCRAVAAWLRSSPLEIPDHPYNVSTKQTNDRG